MTSRDFLNHFRRKALFCPKCHSPMRRAERGGRAFAECVRAPECPGARGLPVEYVEDRQEWRREYGDILSRLGEIHQKFALVNEYQPLNDPTPQRVLDMGCAYGHYLRILRILNPKMECFAADLSRDACESIEREGLVQKAFWQDIGAPIPLEDGGLDWMYCFDVIEHVPLEESLCALFQEARRLLKPGGRFFLFFPNFNQQTKLALLFLGGSEGNIGGDHCNMLTAGDAMRLASPLLAVEHVRFVNPILNQRRAIPLLHGLFSPHLRLAYNVFMVLRKNPATPPGS
ncbi:MAG: class I SAM-dependent methyltransferase [Candidatus Omnitrophota bacterium]